MFLCAFKRQDITFVQLQKDKVILYINPFTAMLTALSPGKRPIKVPHLKLFWLFCPLRMNT